MTFSGDIEKFASKVTSQMEDMQADQKERITAFLKEFLGDEVNTITKIKFDNDASKFYDVEAPESVINKLREAGYLRD